MKYKKPKEVSLQILFQKSVILLVNTTLSSFLSDFRTTGEAYAATGDFLPRLGANMV